MSVAARQPIVPAESRPRALDVRLIIMPCVLLLMGRVLWLQ